MHYDVSTSCAFECFSPNTVAFYFYTCRHGAMLCDEVVKICLIILMLRNSVAATATDGSAFALLAVGEIKMSYLLGKPFVWH